MMGQTDSPPDAPTRGTPATGEGAVLSMLEELISGEGVEPGVKLPTERVLVERSGQPRSVVRQALGRLEASGRIVRHVGRGTFVAHPAAPAGVGASGSSPREIMAARLLIEPAAMPLVVLEARQSDFDEMQRCLEGGEQNREYELFEQWDAAFHRSLAAATHNQLLVSMVDLMNEARDQRLWGQIKQRSFSPERAEEYVRDHRAIAAAVAERDGAAAEAAMRAHLLRVRRHLLDF